MELSDLGFDRWFADHARELCGPELVGGPGGRRSTGAVRRPRRTRRGPGRADGPVPARGCRGGARAVRGRLGLRAFPGRTIARDHSPPIAARTFLRRKSPGRDVDFQMIAANIDVALVAQSCHFDFNLPQARTLPRHGEGWAHPAGRAAHQGRPRWSRGARGLACERTAHTSGVPVVPVSNVTGAGLDEVRRLLRPGETCCCSGRRASASRPSSTSSLEARASRRAA